MNVENLALQAEQAEVTMTAVQAMKAGHALLKQQHEKMNISEVDKLMDDMAEFNDDMRAIQETLAQASSMDGLDEGDIEAGARSPPGGSRIPSAKPPERSL